MMENKMDNQMGAKRRGWTIRLPFPIPAIRAIRGPNSDKYHGLRGLHGFLQARFQSNRVQPSPTASNRAHPSPTESNRVQPSPTESNRVQPSPTESNRVQPGPARSRQRLSAGGHIAFVKQTRAQNDFLGYGFAFENFKRGVNGLRAAGRIAEGRVQYSLLHVSYPFLRQSVDAHEYNAVP